MAAQERILVSLLYLTWLFVAVEGSLLSNFRIESLQNDKYYQDADGPVNQTLHIMRNSHLYRSKLRKEEWDKFHTDACSNSMRIFDVVKSLQSKLGDPYCRFIDATSMKSKNEQLRGIAVGLGIRLKRKFRLRELPRTLHRSLFPTFATHPKLRTCLHHLRTGFLLSLPFLARSFYPSHKRDMMVIVSSTLFSLASFVHFYLPALFPLEVTEITSHAALDSGVQVGDRVILVNDRSLPFETARAVCSKLDHGAIGDTVTLSIERPSSLHTSAHSNSTSRTLSQHVTLRRDYVPQSTVSYRRQGGSKGGTGYIAISEFSDNTFDEFIEAVHALGSSICGLIIDLRDNPGGAVTPALDIAGSYLKSGTVLTQMASHVKDKQIANINSNNKVQMVVDKYWSTNRKANLDMKLLILINEYTASASEILVEALCDNNRAVSMSSKKGERTVGKNLAQAVVVLQDGSGLVYTVREFLTPTGRYYTQL